MDLAKSPLDGDITVEKDDLKVYLDPMANGMLTGASIDFSDNRGFMITGTQEKSCGSCKC